MSAGVRIEELDHGGRLATEDGAHSTRPRILAESYAEFMKLPPKSAAMETIRAGLVELLNDPGITDRARLRQLEQLSEEIRLHLRPALQAPGTAITARRSATDMRLVLSPPKYLDSHTKGSY
jgi:hypothetical protein